MKAVIPEHLLIHCVEKEMVDQWFQFDLHTLPAQLGGKIKF